MIDTLFFFFHHLTTYIHDFEEWLYSLFGYLGIYRLLRYMGERRSYY